MLIDVSKYSSSLKKLWSDVFGDDEEYIDLFFGRSYSPTECFAEIIDCEVVSALYLLKGYVKINGKVFEGRYLYAAATAENYRGKSIMSRLIKQAQEYIRAKGISFIVLVPANEGLYGYYANFGFETFMKNFAAVTEVEGTEFPDGPLAFDEFKNIRNLISHPAFHFAEDELKYALSCLDFAEYVVFCNSADSYYIMNKDKSEVLEYISSENNFESNTKLLLSKLKKGTSIVSPYDLKSFCECEERKFGMIYSHDAEFKECVTDNIYMNIALD